MIARQKADCRIVPFSAESPVSNETALEINSNFDVPIVVTSKFDKPPEPPGVNGYTEQSIVSNIATDDKRFPCGDKVILEQTLSNPPRITSLCKLAKGGTLHASKNTDGIEAVVLAGSCNNKQAEYHRGSYLRFPVAVDLHSRDGCLLFLKQNQFLPGDNGQRHISIYDDQKWMPGPTDEILVKPLHVFGTESIMVLHWKQASEFRPFLNPNGEEILVLEGLLQNRDNLYQPLSWIRNPVPDWRDWHGSTDTLLYYKSGHFPQQI